MSDSAYDSAFSKACDAVGASVQPELSSLVRKIFSIGWQARDAAIPCDKCEGTPTTTNPNGDVRLCMDCLRAPLLAKENK